MQKRATTTFRASSWNETPLHEEGTDPKLTRASVEQTYEGDIEGSSTLEYLMAYGKDGSAHFVGMERIEGRVFGRQGSFALEHRGVFAGGVAKISLAVVEGSGTGDLAGLGGAGSFESAHAESYTMELDLTLPEA